MMCFCFNIKGDAGWNPGTIYYYNGFLNAVQGVHNPEEYKFIQNVYRETTGMELKAYSWTNEAPVYARLFGTLAPVGATDKIQEALRASLEVRKSYNEAYWDPKFFTAKTVLKIVSMPGHDGSVVGHAKVGEKFAVLETITQCDYDWARIRYNGTDAWIAMGDILGDEYGLRSLT